MKCFAAIRMFAGVINRRLVFSCHPFFVVCQKGVAAAFHTFEAAQRFLSGQGFRAGFIYRHNGRDWDKVDTRPWTDPSTVISGTLNRE
jgi:hypothetical protein